MNHLQRVTQSLHKLSQKELIQVKAQVLGLLSEQSFKDDDWLIQGYRFICKRAGVKASFSLQHESYFIYKNTSEEIKAVFLECLSSEGIVSQSHLLSLGRTLSKALAEFCLTEFNLPPSMNILLSKTPLIIQAFEKSFPGYLESKLLLRWVCINSQ